jgi:hypothetical protein
MRSKFMKTRLNLILGSCAVIVATSGCITRHRVEVVHAPVVRHVEGPYQRPLLSPGAQFSALPPVVQNTVRAEAGIAQIDRVVKDRTPVGTIYKIYFQHSGVYPPLFVSADGDVLNPDLTIAVPAPAAKQEGPVRLVDLPEEVLKIIADQAPNTEIASIEKQAWGDRSVYIVAFKGDRPNPKLYVRSDGIVLKEIVK